MGEAAQSFCIHPVKAWVNYRDFMRCSACGDCRTNGDPGWPFHRFHKTYDYEETMDDEVLDLCNALNALPGIRTTGSCCGHNKEPVRIFFDVRDPTGLFFITRCVDNRYWQWGWRWNIHLSVGDLIGDDSHLPTGYVLESVSVSGGLVVVEDDIHKEFPRGFLTKGEKAYDQIQDLVSNMNRHLNHPAFLKTYGIDLSNFDV